MKIFITGICGFVGSALARFLPEMRAGLKISGMDNLMRKGAHINRADLADRGIEVHYGDIRSPADMENLPAADWIIDAAACPSVMAGVDGRTSSRQLIEHNLAGTLNILELCRQWKCGLILLSTSRVYSIAALDRIPLKRQGKRYVPAAAAVKQTGVTANGITEEFPVTPPVSLYGASKAASEILALEYALTFQFPLIINRCGVLAGAGQFGRADQGIFAFWIHAARQRHPLSFIGFDGRGSQVRDCLHPRDLAALLARQINHPPKAPLPLNASGGTANSASLAELDVWCRKRFDTPAAVPNPEPRQFDVPWLILNSARAQKQWRWQPEISLPEIMEEIAVHAQEHPNWLEESG